jgi:hypothetical protein
MVLSDGFELVSARTVTASLTVLRSELKFFKIMKLKYCVHHSVLAQILGHGFAHFDTHCDIGY